MVGKTCPNCGKNSYSAGDGYKWVCPHCGSDITEVLAEPAEPLRPKGKGALEQLKKMLEQLKPDLPSQYEQRAAASAKVAAKKQAGPQPTDRTRRSFRPAASP